MVYITLLDIDRLSVADMHTLAYIMECYGTQLVALIHSGSLCVRIATTLVEPFLATIARDALPVGNTENFALIA